MKRFLAYIFVALILASFSGAYAEKSSASQLTNAAAEVTNPNVEETNKTESSNDPEEDASDADSAANPGTEDPEEAEDPFTGILDSDETAKEFLKGYWTNGRTDYIYAAVGDSPLIQWQTNLPYPACHIYVLEDGILVGKSLNDQSGIDEYNIFRIEIVDGNTLNVYSYYRDEETTFVRDSVTVDPSNLRDEYVFWSMDRAAQYLEGEWMTSDLNYFIFDNSDGPYLNTDLPCPSGTGMGFCDQNLCAYTMDNMGKMTFEPAYRFHILGKDTMNVHCYANEKDYQFIRTTGEIDPENLDTEYVFFCDARANQFLLGKWEEKDGYNTFTMLETDGYYGWKTTLPMSDHDNYMFAQKGLFGLDEDEDGNLVATKLFEFDILSRNEITVHVLADDSVHTLIRVIDENH